MAIKFQNYYGCSRSWNLLLSRANTLKIKSSQRGFVKTRSSGFWTRKFRISTVISLFGPWLTLSPLIHSLTTARHFYCSGEAILWWFKDLTKDFKGQRWALGDFNPEVPDPPFGIDFKPFPPWATVQNHSFCPISLPRIDLFDSFGRTPTFRP